MITSENEKVKAVVAENAYTQRLRIYFILYESVWLAFTLYVEALCISDSFRPCEIYNMNLVTTDLNLPLSGVISALNNVVANDPNDVELYYNVTDMNYKLLCISTV